MSGSRENAVATPPLGLEEGPGLSTYSAQGGACSEQQDPPARPKTLGWGVALQPEPETGSPGSDSGGFPEDTWSGFAMSVCSKSPWSRRPHDGLAGWWGTGAGSSPRFVAPAEFGLRIELCVHSLTAFEELRGVFRKKKK